eukprot:8802480-Pyramimonas_sp.AAC.1
MEGPRTRSIRSGFRSAAYQACASRQATKRAPGWYISYGSPSTPGALPLGPKTREAILPHC